MKIFSVTVLLLLSANLTAFEDELQKEVNNNNWRTAERLLRAAESECRQQGNTDNCAAKITFSQAWMYSRRAQQQGDNREAYLQRARDSYLSILKNNPNHIATIDNLILVMEQLNDRAGLERLLPTLERLNENQRAAKVALMIGDLYRSDGNNQRAFSLYNRAFGQQKSSQAVNGMITVFALSPNQKSGERLWEITQSDHTLSVRQSICEAIIKQHSAVDAKLRDLAMVNWVAWLGRDRQLTANFIEQSINLEANPEFRDLIEKLNDPLLGLKQNELQINESTLQASPRRSGWWTETQPRLWALTIAAWSEGHDRLLKGDIFAANTIWTAALQFAPPTRSYESGELEGRWAISLELITDLARLQQLHKAELDPQGQTFKQIERTLFRSKSMAYQVNDLEAIQRHHTLMGKMYADLGLFSESQHGISSAEFQLENAIKTANRRSEQNGVDDPQPALARLLAEGYECKLPGQTGKPGQTKNCTINNNKAANYYTIAARDFIKLDAVMPARQSLESLKVYQPEPTLEVKQLQSVIDLRASLTQEQLQKGQNHPDVVMKQIDLATEWEALGENAKARESINRAVLESKSTEIKSEELYQTLKNSNIDEIKKISREKLMRTPNKTQ